MIKKSLSLLFLIFCLSIANSYAQISVDRSFVHYHPGNRPYQNVIINNNGDKVLHVTVETTEMINPGSSDERRVETKAFIASPRRFSLKGGASRTVRLLATRPPSDTQSVFRARFIPRTTRPDVDVEKNINGRAAAISILTGTGVLAFVHPSSSDKNLRWERKGDSITFKNEGNSYAMLFDGEACNGGTCKEIDSKRIYAGNTWSVQVPASAMVRFKREVNEETDEIVIQP